MRQQTRRLALCGMLTALASALMLVGTAIPVGTYACPMLASLVLLVAWDVCGSLAWGVWAVTAALSLLLAPDKEAAALFLFLGHYPLVKPGLDGIRARLPRVACKLAIFHVAVAAMVALLLWVLRLEALVQELQATGRWMAAALLLLGNGTFLVYDLLLTRLDHLYRRRVQEVLRKVLKY